MERNGSGYRRTKCSGGRESFCAISFMSANNLGAAAESCGASAPDRWRRTQQARLKRGALDKVIEALAEHLEPPSTPQEASPVRNGHRYLTNRTDCLDYPQIGRASCRERG